MFNLDNREKIMDLVNRKGNHIVIPLYVSIGNLKYGLLELDHVKNVTVNSFKVGFGCVNTILSKKCVVFKCQELLQYFQEVRSFHWFDYDESMDYVYYTFECNQSTCQALMNEYKDGDNKEVLDEISMYNDKLFEYVSNVVDEYRKKCIERFNQENENDE